MMPEINTTKLRIMPVIVGIFVLVAILLAGCTTLGPSTVDRDRFDYVKAISESWKRQTLLNLLKIRYLDAPIFLDVASVINQYSMEQELELGVSGEFYNRSEPSFISPEVGARGRYTDRPTITYNPLMGRNFAQSLLRPMPIAAIMILVQSGYPVDYVLRICVQNINGLKNQRRSLAYGRDADPDFFELLDAFRGLQKMDGMAMRPRSMKKRERLVIFFRPPRNEPAARDLKKVMQLLGLDAEVMEFPVVPGNFALNDREIAILSRSIIQIMTEYASYIDVPESDISEGRVYAVKQENGETDKRFPPLIRVRSGVSKPDKAYVAVFYRDSWFWIDDTDLHSKSMFYFLMILFSFTERGDSEQAAPVITLPTN